MSREEANRLSKTIIGAAIEIHRQLGPGLLESAYEACLHYELSKQGLRVERQVPQPLVYQGIHLDCGYRLDLLVEDLVIVELKTVESLQPIHTAQLLTYLKLKKRWLGLLINFNVPVLKHGINASSTTNLVLHLTAQAAAGDRGELVSGQSCKDSRAVEKVHQRGKGAIGLGHGRQQVGPPHPITGHCGYCPLVTSCGDLDWLVVPRDGC